MSNTTNTIHEGLSESAIVLQEIMKLLEKLMEQSDKKHEFEKFRKELNEDERGTMFTLDDAIYGRTIKELAARGIPYCSYDIKDKTRKVLIVADRRTEEVAAIAGSEKLRVGLIIDSKKELDAAVWEKDLVPKEYVIQSLNAPMAQKIMEFANKYNVLAIMEKQDDGTYSIYSIPENEEKLNCFAFSAAWDITGTSGTREVPRLEFCINEREEIMKALEKAEEIMDEAYIFSAENPQQYLHIEPEGFDCYDNGRKKATMRQAMDPDEYAEHMKLQLASLENPVYMTKEEIMKMGGIESQTVKDTIEKGKFIPEIHRGDGLIIQAEKEVRNWIENKNNLGNTASLTKTIRELPYENIEEFKKYFAEKIDHTNPKREEYYQSVMAHLDDAKSHLKVVSELLSQVQVKEVIIERPIDITIEMGKRATMDRVRRERQMEQTREHSSDRNSQQRY